ncbi:ubiquinone biosynthesis protein [Polaribacter sp. KT25b]|uniref:ABC1 kinase family protein n=1 Tax=Polaribacter sp. KT25b TaxID=1855336 RepID=UPI00087BFFD1|nr:AarF/ABC1/UbiB kinase family protein [Polaribacter sp. KT25b]SDS24723.1 ubiquinone biosynthesis protein [Polaribacter sp. KT25b]
MASIKLLNKKQIIRYHKLFGILTKYGFEDIMAHNKLKKLVPKSYLTNHPDAQKLLSFTKFERIRMVLEELGPTYVKLGQIFSNRDDMLPPDLIKELAKLQDHVPELKNFNVNEVVEKELGISISEHFISINPKPIAAASLAQVHKAKLLTGENVVLKIQRPDIQEVIESDILVMKQVAKTLQKYSSQAKAFQPMLIVTSFEKSIREELQFLKEVGNMERFTKNFEGNEAIYVPKAYRNLCTDKLICMEFITGVKVSEIATLNSLNINPVKVAKVGVDLYLQQVIEYGFFHADPHPGNIFVLTENQQICFIDFGMMGSIMPNDKEALSNLLIYFLKKDVQKIITVLERVAVKVEVSDYKKLKYDLYELVEGFSDTSLQDIKLSTILTQFKTILYENKITLPHYLYMLIRALIIIEGVGLKLDPAFSITDNLQPYTSKITKKRFSIKRLFKKNLNRLQDISDLIEVLPNDINTILKKIKEGKLVIVHEHKGLNEFQETINKSVNRLVFAVIIAALSIGSSILVIAKMPPLVNGIPLLGAIGFLLSAILGFYILISIFRNNQFKN